MQSSKLKVLILVLLRRQNLETLDLTIHLTNFKPAAKLPEIVKIDSLAIFDTIGVTSHGYGYGSIEPKIILLDGETGNKKEEVDLRFSFGSNQLQIVSNTYGINPGNSNTSPNQ